MAGEERALLSEEESAQVADIMGKVRRVQGILDACIETTTELLEQTMVIARRHGLTVHHGGARSELQVPAAAR